MSLQPSRELRAALESTVRKIEKKPEADAIPDLVRLKRILLERIAALDAAEATKQP